MTVNGNTTPTEKDLLAIASDFNLSMEKCKKIIQKTKMVLKKINKKGKCL